MKITEKTVLITGASSGLGREIALRLSTGNNRLVVTARRQDRLEALAETVRENGSECLVCPADATDPDAVSALLARVQETHGNVDVAVLNAGGGVARSMKDHTAESVVWSMRTNYDTLANFLCPMIQQMKETGGTIAYTGSPAGYFGLPKSGPYSAAKAAGRTLFDTCRIELADTPIRFVALYPGFTYTDGMDADEVPFQWLIIERDRAATEMIRAIEKGWSHHIFPKRIKFPITLARLLPEPLRRWILSRFA